MSHSSPSTHFRLLDLPVEVREHILRYALQVPYYISPRVSIPRDAFVLRLPPLTRTCHLLRKESLPLYFECNTFHFNLKDVLETPLEQDLRFEKKLLTFGAWCEAVGSERFARIRSFALNLRGGGVGGGMYVPNVVVTVGRFGKVDVEAKCLWQGEGGGGPKYEAKPAPEELVRVVREVVARNQGSGCLLPRDVVQFCRAVERFGPALPYLRM
ncbi:hypothetical protein M409DRAFT_59225 [Zasmidium cellare ATCC 36951]|uniref:F-box domain-containing protein n=1 Tax=Zasmidium cellare ATCC 36951 TaxID=1080233 RepID=A0A6A6C4W1_ZASCE|nr:uncharacterized protein M409DRAFT_59225 [Zasmidium cellare ATCC 36951]KAF2161220.1 hypothetical protein M409DRAFT_59225 [Zasmidium cellare ATCC 36951]